MNNSPRNSIYPGWYQVGATSVGTGLSFIVIAIVCFSIFVKPLQDEFGWARSQIALALTITTFVQALINPFLGALLDRWGVRRVLLPSIVLMGLTIASAYFLTDSLWHFYLIYLLITFLGAGTGAIVYSRLLVNWFDRRRGLALGIGLSGIGLGAALIGPLLQKLIDIYSWREAYLAFAALVLLVSLPVAVLMTKDTPADAGLSPDEADPSVSKSGDSRQPINLSMAQAVRIRQYPLMLAAYLCFGIGIGGIVAHLFPMMLDQGISSNLAATAAAVMGLSMIVGRIGCGVLMDRFYAPVVAAFFMGLPAISILLFATGITSFNVLVAALFIGLGVGAEFNSIAFLISRYVGLKNFGKIYGHIYAIFQFGHGIGPISMGIAFDRTGEYTAMLWVALVLVVIGAILTAMLGEYRDDR